MPLRSVFLVVQYTNRANPGDFPGSFNVRLEPALNNVVSLDWTQAVFERNVPTTYDSNTVYAVGSFVLFNGGVFICIQYAPAGYYPGGGYIGVYWKNLGYASNDVYVGSQKLATRTFVAQGGSPAYPLKQCWRAFIGSSASASSASLVFTNPRVLNDVQGPIDTWLNDIDIQLTDNRGRPLNYFTDAKITLEAKVLEE